MADHKVQILAGNVLLNSYTFDFDMFKMQFYDDWKIEIEEDANEFVYEFKIGEVSIACMLVPAPKDGVAECGANNYSWKGAAEAAAAHVAHVEVGVMDCEHPLRRHVLNTMVVSSMLKQDNVIGYQQYPTVHNPYDYIEGAKVLKKDEFPITLWVYIGLYKNAKGTFNCYTYGMDQFDKEELEIVDTDQGLVEMYKFMVQIVTYLIANDDVVEAGNRIGSDEEHSYMVTRSEAVAFEGESLKIAF